MNRLPFEPAVLFLFLRDLSDAPPLDLATARPTARAIDALLEADRIGFVLKYVSDITVSNGLSDTFSHMRSFFVGKLAMVAGFLMGAA
jgi:hypothetical protein